MNIVIDTETTSLDFRTGRIVCLGYKIDDKQSEVCFENIPKDVVYILESPNYLKIGHNIGFDIKFLMACGINIIGPYFDTKIAYFQNHPFESLALKDILSHMGDTVIELKDLLGKGKNKKKITEIDREELKKYCLQDVDGTYKLFQKLKDSMNSWTNYIEFGLIDPVIDMESSGLFLDKKNLESIDTKFRSEILDIEELLKGINLRSPKQVRDHLISLGYSRDLSKYVTNSGQVSTDKLALKELSRTVPMCKILLRHRELSKLVSTYTSRMKDKDFLFGNFNQCGTRSGRFSSSNPNFQNIPSRTQEGRKIRECIIPRPHHKLIVGDLSMIEPRLFGNFSQDKKMVEMFNGGGDFHTGVAREIFDKLEVNKDERFIGKTVGLATFYGASVKRLLESLISYDVKISYSRVAEIRKMVLQSFPRVSEWVFNETYKCQKQKYILTIGGRKIPLLEDINIINYKVQGSASDIMKLILLNLYSFGYKILATIHDEVLVEVNENENKVNDIKDIMEHSFLLKNVPIVADVKEVSSWGEK